MAFSELELKRIDQTVGALCRRRSPAAHRDELRLEYRVTGHDVLIYETRPDWQDPSVWMEHGVAKLRFVRSAREWRLYRLRATLKWESYEPLPSSRDLADLVAEVDADRFCCFFG